VKWQNLDRINPEKRQTKMLEANRRGNTAWLFIMLVAFLVLIASGALPLAVLLALAGLALLTVTAAGRSSRVYRLRDRASGYQERRRISVSQAARLATEQASQRPDHDTYGYRLQDVGLVVEETSRDGLRLRHARLISMDDDALRPYIVVNAPRHDHPKQTLVRFEINDAAGNCQFVCEMEHFMRPGENLLLPDYRLPLRGNERLGKAGKWDLQAWINGGLVAVHTFSVSPSLEERRRQFGLDGEAQVRLELERDPLPLSLKELLEQEQRRTARR
jgi:hypothetical protein